MDAAKRRRQRIEFRNSNHQPNRSVDRIYDNSGRQPGISAYGRHRHRYYGNNKPDDSRISANIYKLARRRRCLKQHGKLLRWPQRRAGNIGEVVGIWNGNVN
jgi:hypothetical protein